MIDVTRLSAEEREEAYIAEIKRLESLLVDAHKSIITIGGLIGGALNEQVFISSVLAKV